MSAAPSFEADDQSANENAARIVWALAWPTVALNSLQSVNSLLDSYFVQHLSEANLTAIGAATGVLFLFISITFALGTAATALVSRFFGANDHEGYVIANRKCIGLSMLGGVIIALLTIPGSLLLRPVIMPSSETAAFPLMMQYLGIFSIGLPAIFIIQVLAGSLRGIGDTKSPMVMSGIQIIIHIALNTVLINGSQTLPNGFVLHGLGWGLAGAATAMVVSAWVSAVAYLMWASRTPLGSSFKSLWPGMEWTKRILRIAVPAGTMSLVRVTSLLAFTGILTRVPQGQSAVGALRPAFSVESLAFMPGFALSIAAAALVGQSLGMKKPERAERLAWTAAHHAALVGLLASAVLFVFAPQVSHLLMPDQPGVSHHVEMFLRYICLTEVLFGYGMVLVGAMQGAGDTMSPLWLTIISMWCLRVPLAWYFAHILKLGANGCWIAMSATQAVQGIAAIVVFRQGRWKFKKV